MSMNHLWETKLTANDSTAQEQLGILRTELDSSTNRFKTYKYVVAAADTTVADGTALCYTDLYGTTASLDISDGAINQVCGVGVGVITASYYGWVQTWGYHDAVLTDGGDDIADGDSVILHASSNGVCNSTASGTAAVSLPIGIAVDADIDGSNTVEVFIRIEK